MKRFKQYNPNPRGYNVGDCTIRALSKVLNQDWEQTYCALSAYGYVLCNMPSANYVWGTYLRDKGYERLAVDDDTYTVSRFAEDNPRGVFVLALQGHVVAVVDGNYYDSWDSGNEIVYYFWRLRNVRE